MTLIGRTKELDLLRALLEQVASGRGAAAWVEGEPGIGKSALLAEVFGPAVLAECQVYAAVANEHSALFPLHLLVEALRVHSPAMQRVQSNTDPLYMSRAEIIEILADDRAGLVTPVDAVPIVAERLIALVHRLCALAPTVLVVDDVQWVDSETLWVLARLGRLLGQLPLLLVIAGRPVPQRTEVEALRVGLGDAGVVTLAVGPLA